MALPRPRRFPVGTGEFGVPHERTSQMPGLELPQPGGNMKKLSLEFADAADAAAATGQPQGPPPGAGVLPAGAQAPPVPPQAAQQAPPEVMPQEQMGGVFGQMAGGADQFGQGPDSSMFSDQQLQSMLQEDPSMGSPMDLEADQLEQGLMDPNLPPEMQQEMQMRMMQAARRAGGF